MYNNFIIGISNNEFVNIIYSFLVVFCASYSYNFAIYEYITFYTNLTHWYGLSSMLVVCLELNDARYLIRLKTCNFEFCEFQYR